MELYNVIHGFAVTGRRPLPELEGVLWQLEHRKSGAKLVWLDRPDDNRTFCITFRTPPEDDTGVFHILEHTVLGGSERYPVKEPFVALMRSSVYLGLCGLRQAAAGNQAAASGAEDGRGRVHFFLAEK